MSQSPWPELVASGLITLVIATLGLVIRSIVKGDLVPRSVLTDEKERADKWEAAWRVSEARIDALEGRLTALNEGTELNTQLLSSLVERARR
ncbi:hypothetical protein [Actinomadura rudentiformis]|uniref:DUF2746 domain-containing protein n=1 Tax=Actinomadura rudentiformis TaxID=359158 RepID=A0A6H9YT69_9ACTN|nr:hypothetical protein [Actinomadura rudentiformis]KAB2347360.1 hypothetical protein F8566_20320 [Actinomadura rudentiformis]